MEINKTYSPLETELTGINHYLGRIVLSNLAESIRRCFINMFCDSQHGLKLVNSESISLCKKLKRGTFTDRELALVKMIHKKKNDMLGKGVSLTFTQWESQIADKLVSKLGLDCAKPKDTVLSQSELFGRHDLFTADDFKKDIRMAKEIESQVLRLWMVDTFRLSDNEEVGLQKLERRINVPYDCSNPHHRTKLQDLWGVSFPEEELHGLISEQWTKMGWQGKDPSTDLRGFTSLENLLFFVKTFPKAFQDLLQNREGREYPFAVAGVNITSMLIQMLDLEAVIPRRMSSALLCKLLSGSTWFVAENEVAFDALYCRTFKLMDQQWLSMNSKSICFNEVIKSTRCQLEGELLFEDITRIEDMPSYSLLS